MSDMEVENVEETVEKNTKTVRVPFLDLFNKVADPRKAIRLQNVIKLVSNLHHSTNQQKELKYSIQRLLRGLGSANPHCRHGFYLVLVSLLKNLNIEAANTLMAIIRKELTTSGSDTTSERKHIYMGQLLACAAIIRSGLFLQLTTEQQNQIIILIMEAKQRRKVLQVASTLVMRELLEKLDKKHFFLISSTLETFLLKPFEELDLSDIYLRVLINSLFPSKKQNGLLANIINEENLSDITSLLLEPTQLPVYELITKEIHDLDLTLKFVKLLEMHANGLNHLIIVENLLKHIQGAGILSILSEDFFEKAIWYCTNAHRNKGQFLNKLKDIFDLVGEKLKDKDSTIRMGMINKLLFYPWNLKFEKLTKHKLLHILISRLDKNELKELIKLYKSIVEGKIQKQIDKNGSEAQWRLFEKIEAIHFFSKLLTHTNLQTKIKLKVKNFAFLFNFGLISNIEISSHFADAAKRSFYANLDHRFKNLEDLRTFLYELANYINNLDLTTLRTPLDEENKRTWLKTMKYINELQADNEKWAIPFQILLLHLAFQLFQPQSISDQLNELIECLKRLKGKTKDGPEWIEVVVDVFLNLSSQLSRSLHNRFLTVFPYFCEYLTPSTLNQLLSVLDPQQDNVLTNQDEGDGEESSSDEEAELSDEGEESGDEGEESGDEWEELSDKGEEPSDGDETDLELDCDEPVKEQFKMAIRNALGPYNSDDESVDLDDLDEEEGQKLDKALSDAFKTLNVGRKNRKQNESELRLMNFRLRVLDFLIIYIESKPTMISSIEILLPLMQLFQYAVKTDQKPLEMKVKNCLNKLTDLKKFTITNDVTEEMLSDLLSTILSKENKSKLLIKEMTQIINKCAIFIIKCQQQLCADANKTHTVYHVIRDLLREYFKENQTIPNGLYKQILLMNWTKNFHLIKDIFKMAADENLRAFKRAEALNLIHVFYTNQRLLRAYPEKLKKITILNEELLNSLLEMPEKHNKNVVQRILELLLVAHAQNVKVDQLDEKLDRLDLNGSISLYRTVCNKYKITVKKQQKRKLSENVSETTPTEDKKKKKRKNSQSKKEKLELRAKDSNKGLENGISFSNLELWKLPKDDVI